MLPYRAELLFSYELTLAAPVVVGPCPHELRLNFTILGGRFKGERLAGQVLPGAVDSATLRSDGVVLVDVRGLLQTDDGAIIDMAYTGVLDLGETGYADFLQGRAPDDLQVRAAPRFRAAHPAYQWLNRLQCYSVGKADLATLSAHYDVYALR